MGNNHSGLRTGNFNVITPNRLLLGRNNRRGLGAERINFELSANLQKLLAMKFSGRGTVSTLTTFISSTWL